MSSSVTAYVLDIQKLTALIEQEHTRGDLEMIPCILAEFGNSHDNIFVITSNEYADDYNARWGLTDFIQRYYGITELDDDSCIIVSTYINNNAEEAADELGIELPEADEDNE